MNLTFCGQTGTCPFYLKSTLVERTVVNHNFMNNPVKKSEIFSQSSLPEEKRKFRCINLYFSAQRKTNLTIYNTVFFVGISWKLLRNFQVDSLPRMLALFLFNALFLFSTLSLLRICISQSKLWSESSKNFKSGSEPWKFVSRFGPRDCDPNIING